MLDIVWLLVKQELNQPLRSYRAKPQHRFHSNSSVWKADKDKVTGVTNILVRHRDMSEWPEGKVKMKKYADSKLYVETSSIK